MLERAQHLVKIEVSGLIFQGSFMKPMLTSFSGVGSYVRRGSAITTDTVNIGPLKLTFDDAVATITLDRQGDGNSIDGEMSHALSTACELIAENHGLRLLVLTANGEVFSIDKANKPSGNPAKELSSLSVPVLVALNGDAAGAGLELALAGDLRVCVPSAKFGFPGLAEGVLPRNGGTQRLPRLIGPAWARDMLLTGRLVDANEALSIGLVNRVSKDITETVAAISAQITSGSPIGARYAKEAVSKGMDLTLEQGLRLEADLNVILQSTSDRAEGLKSFLEKRGPEFIGS